MPSHAKEIYSFSQTEWYVMVRVALQQAGSTSIT